MHIINMKIGQRLTLGFGIVIALLIAITILSNTQLGQLSNSIHLITKDRYPKTVLANAVQIEVNKIALNLRDIMLSSDADRIKNWCAIQLESDKKMNAGHRPGCRDCQNRR